MNDVTWLYLPSALILGMAHALEPGHSKAVVASYLIGAKGKPRDAVVLGLTVTLTHTFVVFLLAIGALALGAAFPMQQVQHWLELVSAILVVVMGAWLLRNRLRERHHGHEHDHGHEHGLEDEGHHDHAHPHGHSHPAPPSGRLSWKQLFTFGLSGGLVPCPAALAVLLLTVGIGKPLLGLASVVVFSIGLATTLIVIGIAVCRGASWAGKRFEKSRWLGRLPILSALFVVLMGLGALIRVLAGNAATGQSLRR